MSSIHQEVAVKAAPKRIYEALMDSKQHAAFTANGWAKISRKAGGEFACHGGMIEGRNIELIPNKRIVLAWRVKIWPKGVYSIVKFELEKQGAGTRIVLEQTGIPPGRRADLNKGWKARYWTPLKAYLE